MPTASDRFWAKVDRSGDCWLWTGAKTSLGYGYFWWDGKVGPAHRFSYEINVGPIPDGLGLDHRATCPKSCVNPTHLRPTTQKQNLENQMLPRSMSGFRGVTWAAAQGKWKAQVRHHGKQIHVGYFTDVEEAARAARDKRNELFTHNDMDRDARL